MEVPKDIHDIKPQITEYWNCDELGFDPNGDLSRDFCAQER